MKSCQFWTLFTYKLMIINFHFRKKKEDHMVTIRSGTTKTQIDYFLIRMNGMRMCWNRKVIPSEYLETLHIGDRCRDLKYKDQEEKVLDSLELNVGILPMRTQLS